MGMVICVALAALFIVAVSGFFGHSIASNAANTRMSTLEDELKQAHRASLKRIVDELAYAAPRCRGPSDMLAITKHKVQNELEDV